MGEEGPVDNAPVACPGGATCGDPHDADNVYTWTSGQYPDPDGSAFTLFLDGLNSTAFAGHSDWRLPLESGLNSPFIGLKELESIELEVSLLHGEVADGEAGEIRERTVKTETQPTPGKATA